MFSKDESVLRDGAAISHLNESETVVSASQLNFAPTVESDAHSFPLRLVWHAGGIRGPSLTALEATYEKLYSDYLRLRNDSNFCSAATKPALMSLMEHLSEFDSMTSTATDCRYQLPPHLRSVCMMALARPEEITLSRALRRSPCAKILYCMDWARGRFATRLNATLLRSVYSHLKSKIEAKKEAAVLFAQQFVHGGSNFREKRTLMQRVTAMGRDLDKRLMLHRSLEPETPKPKPQKRKPPPPSRFDKAFASQPSPMIDVFRGLEHVIVGDEGGLIDDSGGQRRLITRVRLRPLEVLAALFHMAGDEPAVDLSSSEEAINAVVFNGDSTNRELFQRLIYYLRYGDANDSSNSGDFPIFHFGTHYDIVYAIYEDRDDVLTFDTALSNGDGVNTVERYFTSLRREINEWRALGAGAPEMAKPAVALMYIVFYWDPFTSLPRNLPFDTDFDLGGVKSLEGVEYNVARNQSSLAQLGIVPRLIIQGTAFWERVQSKKTTQAIGNYLQAPQPAGKSSHLIVIAPMCDDRLDEHYRHLAPVRLYNQSVGPLKKGKDTPQDAASNPRFLEHYNLLKTVQMFEWLQDITPKVAPTKTVRILDKAKAQFFGHPMRDAIHFTARSSFVFGSHKYLKQSLSVASIEKLLPPAEVCDIDGIPTPVAEFVKRLFDHNSDLMSVATLHNELAAIRGDKMGADYLPYSTLSIDGMDDVEEYNSTVCLVNPQATYAFINSPYSSFDDPGDLSLLDYMATEFVLRT